MGQAFHYSPGKGQADITLVRRSPFAVLNAVKLKIIDVGASQAIIDGKIKLKNDSQISRFTKSGLLFENGSTLDADVVIFATGYGCAVFTFYLPISITHGLFI